MKPFSLWLFNAAESGDLSLKMTPSFSGTGQICSLRRLQRGAQILSKSPEVEKAIRDFKRALPGLSEMRNIGEHIDAYAIDDPNRHHGEIGRKELQVGSWEDPVFKWLGYELNIDNALKASVRLFEAIKAARSSTYQDR